MNPYKFNGNVGSLLRIAICDFFKIPYYSIYKKKIKNVDIHNSTITTDSGEVYKITLIKQDEIK
jgi:hypothetical protein